MRTARLLVFLPLAFTLSGCPASEPTVTLKGHRYAVEIVNDEPGRERGLMFRDHLEDDRGMWFVFDDLAPRAFWMKNCRIGLDILFFDASYRFVSGAYRVPPCQAADCPSYPSAGPARYVLELNAGVGQKLALKPGDPITPPAP